MNNVGNIMTLVFLPAEKCIHCFGTVSYVLIAARGTQIQYLSFAS